MWLKMYLNFSPTRPEWALITDLIIEAPARKTSQKSYNKSLSPMLVHLNKENRPNQNE